MATGETGFDDVTSDLISVQYHSLKAGHDYGQYVRDAENAGQEEIAGFFRQVMEEDSSRALRCHEFLRRWEAPTTPARSKEASDAGRLSPAPGTPEPVTLGPGPLATPAAEAVRLATSLLLIPLILVGVFTLPFAMAWLEPKPKPKHTPTHRALARRTASR